MSATREAATSVALEARRAWCSHVERATIAMPDPDLGRAVERFERIGLAEQMNLAREIARTRQSELTLAYDNVVTVASGFKTRQVDGSESLTRTPAVVFVVRRKWRTDRSALQRIPSHLLTYRGGEGARELVAVPTDVQPEQRYSRAKPCGPCGVFVDDGIASKSGALACLVELRSQGERQLLAMSALHVLSISVDAGAGSTPGAGITRRTSASMPDGTPRMARASAIGGRFVGSGMSFDVQLAELADREGAIGMLADLPLAADEPFVADLGRLHRLVEDNAPIEILVPTNHPSFIGRAERPRMAASYTGPMESGFAIDYMVRADGVFAEMPLHHAELIRLQPLGGQAVLGGDSGCAVVCWLDDERCTLLGMLIAGDDESAYAIPAWRLFDPGNYFGTLDGAESLAPVRA